MWDLFFDQLRDASCMSVGASRTGNQTLLRIRVGGKRHELRIDTGYLKGARGPEHVVGEILRRFFPGERSELIRDVQSGTEFVWERTMGPAFSEPVRAEARVRGIRFLDDAAAFVFKHAVGARQAAFQRSAAMEEFRTRVREAIRLGGSYAEMEDVLKEESVRSVMES